MTKPSEYDLSIEPVHENGGVRLVVSGELDLACAPRLAAAIEERIGSGESVIVDLTGLKFMDSSGLATILNASALAERNGGELAVASPPAPVDRIFDLTDTRRLLKFV